MSDPPRVSVVVPVFDPGPWVRPLLDSLDAQTLPREQWEAVLVDDGSTDGTGELLDRWAGSRPHVSVLHQANSGWPCRPRNTGIDAARGRYVFLVDADDWLSPLALERMSGFADAAVADVVIGRMVGVGRQVPIALFRGTEVDARPPAQPLPDSMTCHALFRRAFLDAHGLRFDESQRRLEDHLFMTRVYAAADPVSVYADDDVYWHAERDDGAGAGYRRYRAEEYYPALRRCLDAAVAAFPPGAERDAYLGRWIRIELVGRLQSDAVRWLPRAERDAFLAEAQSVLQEYTTARTLTTLTRTWRWPTALARVAGAEEFARAESLMTTSVRTALLGRPGSTVLEGAVSRATLAAAVADLGVDEPLPETRAAADPVRALARRSRERALGLVAGLPGGGVHRLLVEMGRTPRLLLRRLAAVGALAAGVAAGLLAAFPVVALVLAAASVGATSWRAIRSTGGVVTALLQAAALSPAGVVAAGGGPVALAATLAGLVAVAAGLLLDRRWRRTDARAHAGRAGGPVARLGWIAQTGIVVGAIVVIADAVALLTG